MTYDSMKLIESLSEDTADFWADKYIPILKNDLSEKLCCTFLREAFSKYHPVIIEGLITDWPALSKWNMEYFKSIFGEKKFSVNLTPDGMADSVQSVQFGKDKDAAQSTRGDYFIYPAESMLSFDSFDRLLKLRKSKGEKTVIPYLSQQNDNLRTEFPELLHDIKQSGEEESMLSALANNAFGCVNAEAINLWIGDENSVSSIHKDHFENFYAVVDGEKTFTLFPPSDIAFMPEHEYPTLKYSVQPGSESDEIPVLFLTNEGTPSKTISWIPIDPDSTNPTAKEQYPLFEKAHPIRCRLRAGQVLYIPAMWYHRVSQTTTTISVNYWFDQRFDFRYILYKTVKDLTEPLRKNRTHEMIAKLKAVSICSEPEPVSS